ncbi:hypothetical protein LCGC14_2170010 [marine sediment metagenome]|uniref:Uncharacterized protein n=1 Tax=marine sediment metagenome TaxID=412755 RepID=A0A0F9ECI8_9ZZZZ
MNIKPQMGKYFTMHQNVTTKQRRDVKISVNFYGGRARIIPVPAVNVQ